VKRWFWLNRSKGNSSRSKGWIYSHFASSATLSGTIQQCPSGYFEKKICKFMLDLKYREMQMKINFGHQKWPPVAIFKKKMKVCVGSEISRNANEN
jgi:hypothetical protein